MPDGASTLVRTSGSNSRSACGRIWPAKRTPTGLPIRSSVRASIGPGGASCSAPLVTRTRQVEKRPRPPQTDAWGIPGQQLAPKTAKSGPERSLAVVRIGDVNCAESPDMPIPQPAQSDRSGHKAQITEHELFADP